MSKIMKNILLLSCFFCLLSQKVFAEDRPPVAGEVIDRSSEKTYPGFKFDSHPNIMGFMTPRPIEKNTEDVYFSANEIQNDNETNTITATGH